jgi:TolB-like protein
MNDPPSRLNSFLSELKRRRVYRVAVVYVVVGLGVLGAAEVILDPLGLEALRAYIVILVLLGFPIALVLAWAYEVKPEEPREAEPITTAIIETAETERKKSIVVLPFDNLSPDPGDAYFSDGLTEEVITNLSHLQSLRVISRNSAMALKGSQKDTRTIAEELDVQYVLEGSVRKAGDDLRITAQLIDAGSDEHLWAEKYDGRLEDVFEMQEKVSRSIVDALALRLSPAEERRLADRPIKNLTAFECLLRARADMWLLSSEGLDRALDWAERGLSIVGDDAELLAMKGVILFQYVNTLAAPPETYSSLMGQAQACADRALSLNPESGWVQWVQAAIRHQSGDPGGMIRHMDRAVALEPSHADALMLLGYQLAAVGRHLDHAHRLLTRAAELDPLTPMIQGALGALKMFEGEFSEAANCFSDWQQALEKGEKSLSVLGRLDSCGERKPRRGRPARGSDGERFPGPYPHEGNEVPETRLARTAGGGRGSTDGRMGEGGPLG